MKPESPAKHRSSGLKPVATSSGVCIRGLFRNQGISMLVILVVMWAVLGFLSPYFFTVDNLFEITLQTAVIGIIAAGETFVIISGGIDLSVGSVFACSAVIGGLVLGAREPLARPGRDRRLRRHARADQRSADHAAAACLPSSRPSA